MSDTLRRLQQKIEPHLEAIEGIVGKKYKLTLIARYTGDDLTDADILLTVDDLQKAEESLRTMSKREPQVKP